MKRGWLDEARAVPLEAVAAALDLALTDRGRALRPCPFCGQRTRHRKRRDRRGAVGLAPNGQGWRCFQCDGSGDALDLVAVALGGSRLPHLSRNQLADVRAWYASRGWCDGESKEVERHAPVRVRVAAAPSAKRVTQRPPEQEVAALWSACRSVAEDDEVATWLTGRRFDPARVAERDLARALPRSLDPLPRWAACLGRPWTQEHRLLFPVYDDGGRMASLRARRLRDEEPKSAAAAAGPGSGSGLVLADAVARTMLATGQAPAWWDGALRLFIAEGEPDFLVLACLWSDANEDAPGVLGVVSGAWTPEVAARVPNGTTVTVSTHADESGDGYARAAAATLATRCTLQRLRLPRTA